MKHTTYSGIDYGHGMSNIDAKNGIRYGVIPIGELHDFAHEDFDANYGEPTCPECGSFVFDSGDVDGGKKDFYCENCEESWYSDCCYGDEPLAWELNKDGYEGYVDSYNDVMLTKSPYYTHAQFCSPCAPGAGHLSNPCPDGPKTYCFGHDWFEGEVAPYPVYSVETGELVLATGAIT